MTATLTDPTTAYPTTALGTHDLETELLSLAGNLAAAQCRFLQLLAEFDRRDGWAGPGLKSCAHWLCWRIGMSLRTATEHVRVAHALTHLPKITEAFAAGRISYSKVRAITRVIGTPAPGPDAGDDPPPGPPAGPNPEAHTDNAATADSAASGPDPGDPSPAGAGERGGPEPDGSADGSGPQPRPPHAQIPALATDAEQVLLDLALAGTASHVEKIVRATRRARTHPTRTTALRSLSWHYDGEGCLILRGRFTPDQGAHLIATIDALVDHPTPNTHPVPEPPEGWRDTAREHAPRRRRPPHRRPPRRRPPRPRHRHHHRRHHRG